MSESESSANSSDDLEPTGVPEAEAGTGTSDVPAAASAAPKRFLVRQFGFRRTVIRVIIFGLFFVAIYMLIQDRLASSRWTEAHEWIKAEMEKADENGVQRSHLTSHMLEEYSLYPEDHPTLPIEYYRWPTLVRVFTIRVQFANTQVVQRQIREIRYNWMEEGVDVIEEAPAGSTGESGKAPPPPGLPGGGGGGGGRPPGN